MSPREVLERRLHNDARNLAWLRPSMPLHKQFSVTADCAGRYVAALDFGDPELLRMAEGNLRLAVKGGDW